MGAVLNVPPFKSLSLHAPAMIYSSAYLDQSVSDHRLLLFFISFFFLNVEICIHYQIILHKYYPLEVFRHPQDRKLVFKTTLGHSQTTILPQFSYIFVYDCDVLYRNIGCLKRNIVSIIISLVDTNKLEDNKKNGFLVKIPYKKCFLKNINKCRTKV